MKILTSIFWYLAFWPGYLVLWITLKQRTKGKIRESKKNWKNRDYWAPIITIFLYLFGIFQVY